MTFTDLIDDRNIVTALLCLFKVAVLDGFRQRVIG